jgi:cytochrome c biogenesis protein CcmG, thiol:disulfide interchange protein DsbE
VILRGRRLFSSRRPLQAAALGLVAFLLVLLGLRVLADDRAAALAADVHAGKAPPAPQFSLPRLDGRGSVALSSLRGKVVLLNFWASWCVPCKQEARMMEASSRRWRRRGVVFLGVDAQDFESDARRFVQAHGVTYLNVHDGGGGVASRYGVTGFPETWFVDPRGKLVVEHVSGPLASGRLDHDLRLALGR